jgi:hypothetical protein
VQPLYQELDASGTAYTGRVVDPDILLKQLRIKLEVLREGSSHG